jgi:BMFP domain-containing protein YqiC
MSEKAVNQLIQQLMDAVPEHIQHAKTELQHNFRPLLQNTLGQAGLVTQDEFNAQCQVLANTRALLEQATAKIEQLEQQTSQHHTDTT